MNFEKFCDQVKATAEKAADKINKTSDLAALQLKLSVSEKHLKDVYAELGHAVYLQMKLGQDQAEAIVAIMERVTAAKKEIADLENEIKQVKTK